MSRTIYSAGVSLKRRYKIMAKFIKTFQELSKKDVKIATKVLKDGDLVEVDADKGIVRILKK